MTPTEQIANMAMDEWDADRRSTASSLPSVPRTVRNGR